MLQMDAHPNTEGCGANRPRHCGVCRKIRRFRPFFKRKGDCGSRGGSYGARQVCGQRFAFGVFLRRLACRCGGQLQPDEKNHGRVSGNSVYSFWAQHGFFPVQNPAVHLPGKRDSRGNSLRYRLAVKTCFGSRTWGVPPVLQGGGGKQAQPQAGKANVWSVQQGNFSCAHQLRLAKPG